MREGQNVKRSTGKWRNLAVTIYDAAGAPLDVSAASAATYSVRDGPGGALLFASKTLGAGITIATSVVTIVVTGNDTANARPKDYYHSLSLVISGVEDEVMTGRFRLSKSISGTGA